MFISEVERAIAPNFDYDRFELPENVALTFHLNPHMSSADLPPSAELTRVIKRADAVIVESVNNGDTIRRSFNRISQGDSKEYLRIRGIIDDGYTNFAEWGMAFFGALYATRTPVTIIDVDWKHPSLTALAEADKVFVHEPAIGAEVEATELLNLHTPRFEALKQRDQAILENLKPRIDELTAGDRRLQAKRSVGPIQIAVFYGTLHRSLPDALTSSNLIIPTNGFSADIDYRSEGTNYEEDLYARYLRGLDISHQSLLARLATIFVSSALIAEEIVPLNISSKMLHDIASELIGDKDPTDPFALCEEIAAEGSIERLLALDRP